MPEPKYHIHISARHHWLDLNLKEVWRYRDLILLFTRRTFVLTYKQTILGPIWILLNPMIASGIYAFVFGGIAKISTDGVPHILFYLCASAIWNYFSTCVLKNAHVFTDNAGVFGKVYFPRLTVPLSNMLSALIQFGIQMLPALGFLGYFLVRDQVQPNWLYWLLIPLELLHLGALGLGCGILLSSLTTKYRDLNTLVNFGVQLWMYASPVLYPISRLEEGLMRSILLLSPITAPIELIRFAMLGQGAVLPRALLISWGITLVVLLLSVPLFTKVEKTFMDTI